MTAVSDTRLAFEVGGIVETVEVSLGDRVESGQVLARLDPEPFELTVRDAEATEVEVAGTTVRAKPTAWRDGELLRVHGVPFLQKQQAARALMEGREK